VIGDPFRTVIENLAAPSLLLTAMDLTSSLSTQRLGTHHDQPSERMRSWESETSMRPNGHGKLRQLPVDAVTRKVVESTASILSDREGYNVRVTVRHCGTVPTSRRSGRPLEICTIRGSGTVKGRCVVRRRVANPYVNARRR
jgi:hypothetical protein